MLRRLVGCCLILVCSLCKCDGLPRAEKPDESVVIREVPSGASVVLPCYSNVEKYNFYCWHFIDKGVIIGPTNTGYDTLKYNYDVLDGNLTVRLVSKNEEGLYECVSRAIDGKDLNIRVVKMIVEGDWVQIYENDPNINSIRILVALITLVLISGGAYFAYRIWKDRYRYPRYLEEEDEEDEDSGEEIFRAPSTSGARKTSPSKARVIDEKNSDGFDHIDISTDFKSILDTANNK